LGSARGKIVAALGHDPSEEGLEIAPGSDDSEVVATVNDAIRSRHVLELHYYKENEDEFTKREVEPYQLVSGPEGWYLGCDDRAAVVEVPYGSPEWLVREVLKGAGDLVILEPGDAREAVLAAVGGR